MKSERNKKAEITSSQIISIILVIIGFAIILFVYSQISWSGMVDKEVCHQSVIYRGTSQYITGTTSFIPLNCKTDKVCITSGFLGGNCKEFENVKGVTKLKVKNKEEIEQFIARDIIDCWQTMGEGKVSIFSNFLADKYGLGTIYPSCVICTRIAFDNQSLAKSGINLSKLDVMRYMMTHAIPEKNISYFQYLAGEKGKVDAVMQNNLELYDIIQKQETELEREKLQESVDNGAVILNKNGEQITIEDMLKQPQKEDNSELAIVFMQISAPSHSGVLKNTLGSLGLAYGASFFLAPKFTTSMTGKIFSSPLPWVTLVIAGIYQQYSVAENRAISAGYCGDVSVGEGAREGCSVVRTANYDVNAISQYCSVIESIP